MDNAVFGKYHRKCEKTQISSLQQLKQEVIIQYFNQIIIEKKFFSETLLAIETRKTQILMNKFKAVNSRAQ